MSGICI